MSRRTVQFISIIAAGLCGGADAVEQVERGTLVTYTMPGLHDAMCWLAGEPFVGVDGTLWVWLIGRDNARLVLRAPVAELQAGCPP